MPDHSLQLRSVLRGLGSTPSDRCSCIPWLCWHTVRVSHLWGHDILDGVQHSLVTGLCGLAADQVAHDVPDVVSSLKLQEGHTGQSVPCEELPEDPGAKRVLVAKPRGGVRVFCSCCTFNCSPWHWWLAAGKFWLSHISRTRTAALTTG